jgi:hypothetical protein
MENFYFILLNYSFKTFVGKEEIELRILGLLYNLTEFQCLKNHLLKPELMKILR